MRTILGLGAMGDIVRDVQNRLAELQLYPNACDGFYGRQTLEAIRKFQAANALPLTGVLDDGTWWKLMQSELPSVAARCIQLTSSFEGHGYGLAMGDFDGAFLTWGIIGFTLAAGEVQEIVMSVQRSHPELIEHSFQAHAQELLDLMIAPADFQKRWAREHTLANGALAEPWKSMFAAFAGFPEVRQEQLNRVQAAYMKPAIKTARKLGIRSELGQALCFDIHVQNGGIKFKTRAQLQAEITPATGEPELLVMMANAVADTARKSWREDVRSRKLTIATGRGTVHGHQYVLENWGLSAQINSGDLVEEAAPETLVAAHG